MKSHLEKALAFDIKVYGLPEPEEEHRFHPERRWRFDFAWPEFWVAVECEGGLWVGGAHVRAKHFNGDCEKYNEALVLGWRVLRVTADQIESGEAIRWLRKLLEA